MGRRRDFSKSTFIKQTVRNLRKNQTKSEAILWQALRNRKLKGKKFLRQHPIRFEYEGARHFFVADFYCLEKKLVVEIDGEVHERQKDYDAMRTHIINELGIEVIRFRNEEVENDLTRVLAKLGEHL